jgi:hypothetical protein
MAHACVEDAVATPVSAVYPNPSPRFGVGTCTQPPVV